MSASRPAARAGPAASPQPGRSVALLPLPPAPFAVCLLESKSEPPAGGPGDPFRRAAWEAPGSRAYVAELRAETGAVLSRLVLKLPAGYAAAGALYPGEEPEGNLAVEARWETERRDLERLLPAAEHCAELVLPIAGGTAPVRLPPTLYCEVPGRFFRIPCPCCLGALTVCRDDALLAAAGLPLFSSSTVSLLHCAECSEKSLAPRFYAAAETAPAELTGAGVSGLAAVRAELAAALKDLPGTATASALPCTSCPEAAGCLGAARPPAAPARSGRGGAAPAGRWRVFIAADAPYLLTRVAPVACEELFARLGGRDEGEGRPAGGLFAAEGSGIDAVEVLALKLAAFVQLVRAVRQYTLLLARPHLDLHPGQVAVELGVHTGLAPDLWAFRVQLAGVSSARRHRLATAGGAGPEVLLPPPRPVAPFASPAVQAACLASPGSGELLIEKAVAEAAGGPWRIEGKLRDPVGFFPPPGARDWLQLDWPSGLPGTGGTVVAARLDPRAGAGDAGGGRRGAGSELAIVSEPFALDPAMAQRLTRGNAVRVPGIRYRIFPQLDVAEDLYSLGVILFQALLVNDQQGLSDLAPVLQSVERSDRDGRRGTRRTIGDILAGLLADLPEVLGKANVFHRRIDRQPDRPNAIPYEIWTEVLSLALRLIARGPGFGLETDEAKPAEAPGAGEDHPAGPLDFVLAQAEDLVRRLHALLFERQPVHIEIQSLLAELLAEQESPGEAPAGGRGTDPAKP